MLDHIHNAYLFIAILAIDAAESMNQECPSTERPPSPAHSEALTETSSTGEQDDMPSDSSILFKVTIRESTLLAGRPTIPTKTYGRSRRKRAVGSSSFAVIQVSSNALIMFQSVENPDGTGSKTLHASLDNLSSSVNTEFEKTQAPAMIGPTGLEFRIVSGTENMGCIVSNDVSLDCETLKSCLT